MSKKFENIQDYFSFTNITYIKYFYNELIIVMFDSKFIVYVEKDKRQRYKCTLAEVELLKKSLANGEVKIVYFEKFKSIKGAKVRLKNMQLLSRFKLIEMIKDSNPDMLNLINCV